MVIQSNKLYRVDAAGANAIMGLVKRDYEAKSQGSHNVGEDAEDAETNALLNEWCTIDGAEAEECPRRSRRSSL